jgi:hypothetical protein
VAKGIFNPFQKPGAPKKNFVGATDPKNPRDTEYQEDTPKSTIRLDGDSYVLQFNNVEVEELHKRLESLLRDVAKEHSAALTSAGVSFLAKPATPELSPGELRLETPMGFIVVYAGEDGKEVDCFRRLAYALYGLPIKDLLAKHRARVYKRG